MEDYDSDMTKISKINPAQIINQNLENNLWMPFNVAYKSGKYITANNNLDCIWIMLGGDLGKNSQEEKQYNEIEKELNKSGSLQDSLSIDGFRKVNIEQLKKMAVQRKILLKKAIFLRRLQNKQGKGTAYDDPDDEATE